jgi:hypothetical protein
MLAVRHAYVNLVRHVYVFGIFLPAMATAASPLGGIGQPRSLAVMGRGKHQRKEVALSTTPATMTFLLGRRRRWPCSWGTGGDDLALGASAMSLLLGTDEAIAPWRR